jgi:hypothetical protein
MKPNNNKQSKPTKEALSAEFVEITPELAQQWMENNNPHNRKLRPRLVEKYGRDKTNGKWFITHEAVAFDWDDNLVDGQHRLTSIISTGLATKTLVVKGLDPQVRMVVDTGAARNASDVLKLLGYKDAGFNEVAVVRSLMNGLRGKATVPEVVEAYEKHEEAVKEVLSYFPSRRKHITISPVLAPMARVWYTENRYRLPRFAEVLYTGMAYKNRKGEASIIALRDHLIERVVVTGSQVHSEIYGLTEAALDAYLSGIGLTKLVPTKEELFPFPDSVKTPAKAHLEIVTPVKAHPAKLIKKAA